MSLHKYMKVEENTAAPEMEPSGGHGLPSTDSSQQLMTDSVSLDSNGSRRRTSRQYAGFGGISATEWFTVLVLCFVNLINYMDRFTIAGVLNDIQEEFKIGDDAGGLLQTAFVLSYMVCAPIFGYLGDRYSRKWIMILGVALWSGTTMLGSIMPTYYPFLTFRALVGIGEASYSTIAPTLISDLFINDVRSKMLAMFYFAIPVGSGLGYIVGSETAHALGSWRWALRVTPFLGVAACVLIYLTKEPNRGQIEGSCNLEATSYKEDVRELARNPSFMLSTFGFTCVAFVTGALAWWGPSFMLLGLKMHPGNENMTLNDVSYVFGIIAMLAGLIGVPLGSYLVQRLRPTNPKCDGLVCAWGLLVSAPLVYAALVVAPYNGKWCYLLVFLAQISLNLCWSIVADILLYVVIPTRRSTAEAFQILISHTFGDAGSPYLVGVISEAIKAAMRRLPTNAEDVAPKIESLALTLNQNATLTEYKVFVDTNETRFKALQYALFSTCFVEILGGVFFLCTAAYILRDKAKAERAVAESQITETNTETHQSPPVIENESS
ncbi:protein spinster isoform X3 [Bradysia coprophila]|uniref:protein spinster isoform X3 n=1 Tax=Bradysia coprophila TaxID=38358 RepID=UPI00187DBDAC|nr:protein spinster isoform X3 [Bradysia coprophila]